MHTLHSLHADRRCRMYMDIGLWRAIYFQIHPYHSPQNQMHAHFKESHIALITTGTVYKLLRFYNSCRRYVTPAKCKFRSTCSYTGIFFLDQIESCLESNDFHCFYDNNQKLNNFENILIVAYNRHAIEDVI